MEKQNNNLAYISIIAIVAVVGIIGLIMMVSTSTTKQMIPTDFAIGGDTLVGHAQVFGTQLRQYERPSGGVTICEYTNDWNYVLGDIAGAGSSCPDCIYVASNGQASSIDCPPEGSTGSSVLILQGYRVAFNQAAIDFR